MAFCTNCGKPLEEGARFCTNCGTAAQTMVAPTPELTPGPNPALAAARAIAPVTQQPSPASEIREDTANSIAENSAPPPDILGPAPDADFSIAPQSATSSTFVVICVVLVVLIAGGIAGTVYLQRQGKAKAAAAQQTPPETSRPSEMTSPNSSSASSAPASVPSPAVSAPSPATPEPTPATPAPTPATAAPAAAAPVVAGSIRAMSLGNYPGATPVAIATLTGETVVAGFLTRDTPQQVMQYYRVRFPASTTAESQGRTELSATLPGGERIRIQAQSQGTNTQVMVLQEN